MSFEIDEVAERPGNIVIHDELRALFRASRRGRQLKADPVSVPVASPIPETTQAAYVTKEPAVPEILDPALSEVPNENRLGPPTQFRLRCDGRRPVVFDGYLLIERSAETLVDGAVAPVRQEFSLYLSAEGVGLSRIALIVPEDVPARPLYKVAEVGSRIELEQVLARYDPAEGWSWHAVSDGDLSQWHAALVDDLRRDFGLLAKAALGASQIRSTPTQEVKDEPTITL